MIDLFNMLNNTTDICNGMGPVLGLVGWVVLVIKIAVPILLIVLGMIDMTKAVMSKEEKEIKAAQSALIKKVIAAIIVFLVVTIVTLIFSTIMKQTDWQQCAKCINNPTATDNCKVTTDIK